MVAETVWTIVFLDDPCCGSRVRRLGGTASGRDGGERTRRGRLRRRLPASPDQGPGRVPTAKFENVPRSARSTVGSAHARLDFDFARRARNR